MIICHCCSIYRRLSNLYIKFYKYICTPHFNFVITFPVHVFQMAAAERSCDDFRDSWSNYLVSVNNRVREEDYAQWQAESFAMGQRYMRRRLQPSAALGAPADDQQFQVPRPPANVQNPYVLPTRGQQQSQMPLQYVPQQGQQVQMPPPYLGYGAPQPGSFMGMLTDPMPLPTSAPSRVSCDIK